jgi:carboxypeptidase C (cathepsin A)
MAFNPYLKVFSANGYYDAVRPYFQTIQNFENMPLDAERRRRNLAIKSYPSGHMIYLDPASRVAMKSDLGEFYASSGEYLFCISGRCLCGNEAYKYLALLKAN